MKLTNIYLKYCIKYFIAFIFILICCIPIANVSYKIVEQQVMEKNQLKLHEGINEIDQNISKMNLITKSMKQDYHFNILIKKKGELNPDEYLQLKYASQKIEDTSLIYTFPSFSFLLFRDNDLFVSSSQSSALFSSYYGKFLKVDDGGLIDAMEFKKRLFEGESIYSFRSVDKLTYYSNDKIHILENAILCTVKGNTDLISNTSHIMTFVIQPEVLIKMFLTDESRQEGFVQIVDTSNNEILLSYGTSIDAIKAAGENTRVQYEGRNYWLLSYKTKESRWNVTIGYPKSIVDSQVKSITDIITIYIFIGILFVLCLTLFFSYRQYSSVRKLFVTVSGEDSTFVKGQNEYDVLGRILRDITENKNEYMNQMKVLDQQNQALLLENFIVRGINTKEERKEFEKCFAKPLEYFCVVLLKMKLKASEDYQIALLCIVEYLKESYPNDFANVHTGIRDELFLFSLSPKDSSNVQNIKKIFESITFVLTEDMNITFNVGISAIGTDISNINVCYNQAQQVTQAYYSEHVNSIEVYNININSAKENVIGVEFLNKLYNLILCGEREDIGIQFSKLVSYYKKMPFHYETKKQQIFFSVRNVIYSAHLHLIAESLEEDFLPGYKDHYTIQEMAEILEKSAYQLCDYIEEKKKSRNIELKENIINYIKQNYCISSLTAAMVSQKMKISEKYLSHFIKEHTGETFATYLEQLRIQQAKEYLMKTDWSNEKIAEQTGFAATNTFYRAFNKQTGVSPGVYRSTYHQ